MITKSEKVSLEEDYDCKEVAEMAGALELEMDQVAPADESLGYTGYEIEEISHHPQPDSSTVSA